MIKAYAVGGTGSRASNVSSSATTKLRGKSANPNFKPPSHAERQEIWKRAVAKAKDSKSGNVPYKDLSGKLTESLKTNKSVVMSSSGDWGSVRTQITRISDGEYSVSTTTRWSFGSNNVDRSRESFSSMEKAIRYATKGLDKSATYKLSK